MISYYPGFKAPSFFGLDEMHLFGQNLAKRIRDYFVPATSNLSVRPHSDRNQNRYPFELEGVTLSKVGLAMVSSRPDIPLAHFDGNWGNPVERANARAVDWLDFLLYVLPTLLIPALVNKTAKKVLNNLVMACHICQQWEIRPDEVNFVRK
jgi:hypothetical protein